MTAPHPGDDPNTQAAAAATNPTDGATNPTDGVLGATDDFLAMAKDYARLRRLATGAEAEAKSYKQAADTLQERLIEVMVQEGVPRVTVDGSTVFLRQDVYASKRADVDTDDFQTLLRAHDLGDFIKAQVNASQLRAHVRDILKAGEELPADLAAALNYGYIDRAIVTNAARHTVQ